MTCGYVLGLVNRTVDILGWLVIALVIGIGGTMDLMLGSRRYLKKWLFLVRDEYMIDKS